MNRPVFRFAPSPNGHLHRGHAYSALLNADLAARRGGRLLLRIEDIDPARSRLALIDAIVSDLAWLGLAFEHPVRRQSQHMPAYRAALERLIARGLAYPCFCTRGDIRAATADASQRDPDGTPFYPGTCRGLDPVIAAGRAAREPHAWRLDLARALAAAPGPHAYRAFDPSARSPTSGCHDIARSHHGRGDGQLAVLEETRERPDLQAFADHVVVADPARWGDALIARRDVPTSYHLAVVVDDAAQGVTDVVRGRDLEAATDLHVLLQALLGLGTPALPPSRSDPRAGRREAVEVEGIGDARRSPRTRHGGGRDPRESGISLRGRRPGPDEQAHAKALDMAKRAA